MVLNVSVCGSSGVSSDTGKSWNSPGAIFPPLQVTCDTCSVSLSPSSVVIGSASLVFLTSTFHPGTGANETSANPARELDRDLGRARVVLLVRHVHVLDDQGLRGGLIGQDRDVGTGDGRQGQDRRDSQCSP